MIMKIEKQIFSTLRVIAFLNKYRIQDCWDIFSSLVIQNPRMVYVTSCDLSNFKQDKNFSIFLAKQYSMLFNTSRLTRVKWVDLKEKRSWREKLV